ncbi:MAG: hypothetical protein CME68_10415 [Halobacteriovoraceae bacterium]|nr:hypothetical protein [Halobacteriovoraceae bacterium]
MTRKKHSKRNLSHFLISPSFQLKIASFSLLPGVIIVAIYGLLINGQMKENYEILVSSSPMEDAVKNQLWLELDQFKIQFVAFSFLFLILIFFFGIFLSHRVAGPICKMKKVMEQVRKGDRDARLLFRETEEFSEMATSFNNMMDSLAIEESKIERHTEPNT